MLAQTEAPTAAFGGAASEPGPMVPAPFALIAKRQETADTWTLELQARAGNPFSFAPGQFTMLSASGDPDGAGALVHTVRAVGLATQAICGARPGEVLGVRGPFGRPWPVAEIEGADVLVVCLL